MYLSVNIHTVSPPHMLKPPEPHLGDQDIYHSAVAMNTCGLEYVEYILRRIELKYENGNLLGIHIYMWLCVLHLPSVEGAALLKGERERERERESPGLFRVHTFPCSRLRFCLSTPAWLRVEVRNQRSKPATKSHQNPTSWCHPTAVAGGFCVLMGICVRLSPHIFTRQSISKEHMQKQEIF